GTRGTVMSLDVW
nr:immunoglobulin heavy chain junction region [Macaca mulatta]